MAVTQESISRESLRGLYCSGAPEWKVSVGWGARLVTSKLADISWAPGGGVLLAASIKSGLLLVSHRSPVLLWPLGQGTRPREWCLQGASLY